jgi:hypothetical protein
MKTFIYWIIFLAVVAGSIFGLMKISQKTAPIGETTTYSESSVGLEFDYEVGQNGYVLMEAGEEDPNIIKNITLMRVADSESMSSDPDFVGEGPAAISINVFENTAKQFPLSWAMENNAYSNYNLKTEENLEMVVGGANAISYLADGLYPSQNVVVAHGSYMYVFTGQYMEVGNKMHKDFSNLINSIKFIPAPNQMAGKINIDEVCEGALSYMTFSSGEEADKFVAECKEGEHPEVIERYKSDMGITDDRMI